MPTFNCCSAKSIRSRTPQSAPLSIRLDSVRPRFGPGSPIIAAIRPQPQPLSPAAKLSGPVLPQRYRQNRVAARAHQYHALTWGVDSLTVRSAESGEIIRFSYRVLDAEKADALNDKTSAHIPHRPKGRRQARRTLVRKGRQNVLDGVLQQRRIREAWAPCRRCDRTVSRRRPNRPIRFANSIAIYYRYYRNRKACSPECRGSDVTGSKFGRPCDHNEWRLALPRGNEQIHARVRNRFRQLALCLPLLSLCALCVSPAVAQANEPAQAAPAQSAPPAPATRTPASPAQPTHPTRHHATLDDRVKAFATALDLNPTQQVAVKKILEQRQLEILRIRQDPSIEGSERIERLRALQDQTVQRIRGVLNDEQKKKYDPLAIRNREPAPDQKSVEDWLKATTPK